MKTGLLKELRELHYIEYDGETYTVKDRNKIIFISSIDSDKGFAIRTCRRNLLQDARSRYPKTKAVKRILV